MAEICSYLRVLAAGAASAAAPGVCIDTGKFEGASVSVTEASQVSILPFDHGTSVRPSGRLASDLRSPLGSLIE